MIQGKEGEIFPPGNSLEFLCKEGYSRDGVEKVYCLTDETWSDINPVCVLNDNSEGNYNDMLTLVLGDIKTQSSDDQLFSAVKPLVIVWNNRNRLQTADMRVELASL